MKNKFRNATIIQYCNRLVTMFGGLTILGVAADVLPVKEFGLFVALQSVIQLRLFADAIGGGGIVALIVQADKYNKEKLISTLRKMYYVLSAVVALIATALVSIIFVDLPSKELEEQSIIHSLLVILATSVTILLAGKAIILEGRQDVSNAAVLRFILSSGYVTAVLIGLFMGARVYSIGLGGVVAASLGALYLLILARNRPFASPHSYLRKMKNVKSVEKQTHFLLIWGLQWRMLLSWVGGYGMVFLPAPILFYMASPELAGAIGVTFQLAQSLAGLALILLTIRVPLLAKSMLIEGPERTQVKFKTLQSYVLGLYVLSALLLLVSIPFLKQLLPELVSKLPQREVFAMYLLSFLWCIFLYTESIKFRITAREQFWYIYIIGGFVHVATLSIFSLFYNMKVSAIALALIDFLLFVVLVTILSRKFYRSTK